MSRQALALTLAALITTTAFARASAHLDTKMVAAPASDIESGRVRLPAPERLGVLSRSTRVPFEFQREADGALRAELAFEVDGDGGFEMALLSAELPRYALELAGPGAAPLPIEQLVARDRARAWSAPVDAILPGLWVDGFQVEAPAPARWRAILRVPAAVAPATPPVVSLVFAGTGDYRLRSYLTTLDLVLDRPVGIVAYLFDAAGAEEPDAAAVTSAELVVDGPRGVRRLRMLDDGAHGDGAARDGVHGAWLDPATSGELRVQIIVHGRGADGSTFTRTSDHAVPILEREALLTGQARAFVLDASRLAIELDAWTARESSKLHVSAEVFGHDADGRLRPACWLSRMVLAEDDPDGARLRLELDARWLNLEGLTPPLQLRNVRVQDPDTHAVFDRIERLDLPPSAMPAVLGAPPGPVTPEMLVGPPSGSSLPGATHRPPVAIADVMMLVHGYCSGGMPWPSADFSGHLFEFFDPDENRTNDEFALLMRELGSPVDSFGVVAHSQGGAAALHLYTYYHSGLDRARPGRRIQSLATPYHGTPLANLGFLACGNNFDLSPTGAATWLAGIPTWARSQVWYWTTQSAPGPACSGLANLFITEPNDGTVEVFRGQLPGANSMGNTPGWCHTTGMSNPASYTDSSRNALMDAAAAR